MENFNQNRIYQENYKTLFKRTKLMITRFYQTLTGKMPLKYSPHLSFSRNTEPYTLGPA